MVQELQSRASEAKRRTVLAEAELEAVCHAMEIEREAACSELEKEREAARREMEKALESAKWMLDEAKVCHRVSPQENMI